MIFFYQEMLKWIFQNNFTIIFIFELCFPELHSSERDYIERFKHWIYDRVSRAEFTGSINDLMNFLLNFFIFKEILNFVINTRALVLDSWTLL